MGLSLPAELVEMSFPFEETKIDDFVSIRLFSPKTHSEELIWHWDREDREIHVLRSGGWKYQEENLEERRLKNGEVFFIPRGVWHRVMKGKGDLIVKVTKSNPMPLEVNG